MGMMLENLVHPYIQSTTVLCDSILLGAFPSLALLFCVTLHYYAKLL